MRIRYFQGEDGQWYWHLVAKNGRIIADGAEGYTRSYHVLRAIGRFKVLMRCEALPVVLKPE